MKGNKHSWAKVWKTITKVLTLWLSLFASLFISWFFWFIKLHPLWFTCSEVSTQQNRDPKTKQPQMETSTFQKDNHQLGGSIQSGWVHEYSMLLYHWEGGREREGEREKIYFLCPYGMVLIIASSHQSKERLFFCHPLYNVKTKPSGTEI